VRRLLPNAFPSWRLIGATGIVALVASTSLVFSRPVAMDVDGQRLVSDVAPVTAGGVPYLPIRIVGDAAGAVISYDAGRRSLVVRRGPVTLRMTIGDRRATLNGHAIELAHAPFTVHGRAMMRGIDVATALAADVQYDVRSGRIDVRTPSAIVAGASDT